MIIGTYSYSWKRRWICLDKWIEQSFQSSANSSLLTLIGSELGKIPFEIFFFIFCPPSKSWSTSMFTDQWTLKKHRAFQIWFMYGFPFIPENILGWFFHRLVLKKIKQSHLIEWISRQIISMHCHEIHRLKSIWNKQEKCSISYNDRYGLQNRLCVFDRGNSAKGDSKKSTSFECYLAR